MQYVTLLDEYIVIFYSFSLGTDHYFSGVGRGGGMRNAEENCLHDLKRQNKLFANVIG